MVKRNKESERSPRRASAAGKRGKSTRRVSAARKPPRVIPAEPTYTQIAERAYSLYLERDGQDDGPLDDWLQAERELRDALSTM